MLGSGRVFFSVLLRGWGLRGKDRASTNQFPWRPQESATDWEGLNEKCIPSLFWGARSLTSECQRVYFLLKENLPSFWRGRWQSLSCRNISPSAFIFWDLLSCGWV